jgi:hypothetical protein
MTVRPSRKIPVVSGALPNALPDEPMLGACRQSVAVIRCVQRRKLRVCRSRRRIASSGAAAEFTRIPPFFPVPLW